MPRALKWNAAAILMMVIAVLMMKFRLAGHPAFRFDPCDAVWVFGLATIVLSAAVSLMTTFRPYRNGAASNAQRVYAIRSQPAFALAALTILAAELVTLIRNPPVWASVVARNQLLAWIGTLSTFAVVTQLLTVAAQRTLPAASHVGRRQGVLASGFAILALIISPEWPRDYSSQTAHVLTVAVGALVVFIPIRLLLSVLVPPRSGEGNHSKAIPMNAAEWGALMVGVFMCAIAFWYDAHRWASPLRYFRLIALPVAPLLLAYGALGGSLGLMRDNWRNLHRA